jgi:hypothetical protein
MFSDCFLLKGAEPPEIFNHFPARWQESGFFPIPGIPGCCYCGNGSARYHCSRLKGRPPVRHPARFVGGTSCAKRLKGRRERLRLSTNGALYSSRCLFHFCFLLIVLINCFESEFREFRNLASSRECRFRKQHRSNPYPLENQVEQFRPGF